ncbi:MAG: hydroxymethylglutaryl-CoA synthase family protein, partial [Deltaproteobacteria bacterium]|nr:hydroxymethylglutaryl-CoA synthase family protein [Deltaproteobacteria bacterium]
MGRPRREGGGVLAAEEVKQEMTEIRRARVGIEKIQAYSGQAYLDLQELARVRGEDPTHPTEFLHMDKRVVNPCWEDPVTMAVNAAKPMLTKEDLASVELLIFGTESGPDQAKPISTFVQRFLGVNENCRCFEIKHACYGGTAALMMAAHWVASGAAGDAKALVIACDQSRMNLGEKYEYLMGAGAVAMLVSNEPRVAEIELETCAYWTKEVGDTFRPTSRAEAGNTDSSLYCYLEALDGAYAHFCRKNPEIDYLGHFARHIYHIPFGGMSRRAHRVVCKQASPGMRKAKIEESWRTKVLPSLTYTRQFGGLYGASTLIALMGAIDTGEELKGGDRVSIYAYGSGSNSEMYSVVLGPEARAIVGATKLQDHLDARRSLTVEHYEAMEKERTATIDQATYTPSIEGFDGLYQSHYRGKGLLVFRGLDG